VVARQGNFRGISLSGATLRNDEDANAELYGHKMNNKDVINGGMAKPAGAEKLAAALDKYSARK